MMDITVVGSGYVGLVAAACYAELGHRVTCIDRDSDRIAGLKRGIAHMHEQFLPELLQRHSGKRLAFSTQLTYAAHRAQVIVIAVGTPAGENGEADLSAVEAVARELAQCVSGYKVIVEKSTVPVCTSERIRDVMRWNGASPLCFDVVSNPEFLREGTAVTDFLFPDRIVVGADSARAAEIVSGIYKPLTDGSYAESKQAVPAPDAARIPAPLIVTSAKSAELIKHASNSFLAMKISFINAVSRICEQVGADVEQVCKGIGTDSRIGEKFLRPGVGYGGSCFPKDLLAFRSVARECGHDLPLLTEVIRINEQQRQHFINKLRKTLWILRGKKLGLLGLAFKGGTDDIRESPALAIAKHLLSEGCEVAAFDPAAMPRAQEVLGNAVTFAPDAYAAARGADALLVLTDWEEFAELDLAKLREVMRHPVILDGRNVFDPARLAKHGFRYVSIGRADIEPETQVRGLRLLKAS
jgi:UDPglucose 6-dehydrogenase